MLTSLLSARTAASSAVGAGVLTAVMLFGGAPIAQAAPPPAPAASFAIAGPHGADGVPTRGGPGGGGGHAGGWGHGGGGGHAGGWGHGGGGGHGGWGHGGWGRGGWGHGGWDRGGWGGRPGNWWW